MSSEAKDAMEAALEDARVPLVALKTACADAVTASLSAACQLRLTGKEGNSGARAVKSMYRMTGEPIM